MSNAVAEMQGSDEYMKNKNEKTGTKTWECYWITWSSILKSKILFLYFILSLSLSFADTYSPILERLLHTTKSRRENSKLNSLNSVKVFIHQVKIFIKEVLEDMLECNYHFCRLGQARISEQSKKLYWH